ncbi:MAG: shikimate kinase [Candidatus Omnitrophota bacterium]
MRNIAIVGFMGTGKSAVARLLAERLKKTYVSVDETIVFQESQAIGDIFKNKGEPYFRKVESEVVQKVSAMENVVIDCGGGVVIDETNVTQLKKGGPVICLTADPSVIYERVKHHGHRPLLNVPDGWEAIAQLLKERQTYYARADFSIDTSCLTVEEVVSKIESRLKRKGKSHE